MFISALLRGMSYLHVLGQFFHVRFQVVGKSRDGRVSVSEKVQTASGQQTQGTPSEVTFVNPPATMR